MSPEMVLCPNKPTRAKNGGTVGRSTDIWSLGCVVLEICTRGKMTYCDPHGKKMEMHDLNALSERAYVKLVRNGGRPFVNAREVPVSLRDFVQKCLQKDQKRRPTAADLLASFSSNPEKPQHFHEELQRAPAKPLNVLRIRSLAPEQVREAARIEMGIDCINNYNFGIIGVPGTWKYAFINAVRGMKSNKSGAAVVGAEETMKIKAFPHPKNRHVVFWDTPGCGTKIAVADYFRQEKLFCFDSLIVIIEGNIMKADLAIAAEAKKYEVPVFFVCLMSGQIINKIIDDREVSREEAVAEVRKIFEKQHADDLKNGLPPGVQLFVCSARTLSKTFRSTNEDDTDTAAVPWETQTMYESALMRSLLTLAYDRRH